MSENCKEKVVLPHHEQQKLCTTRLPYRQGRKLTAVKTYTVNNESNHLLIFGVPSLNLRQEVKSLFARFGKLLQFNISTEHPSEVFTETYHARFEKIQSARVAKKLLDTKNFYGGSLHVCYAPEFESFDETRQKILKRKQDVLFRLKYLEMEGIREKKMNAKDNVEASHDIVVENDCIEKTNKRTMNMGEVNTIIVNKKKKTKKMKPTPIFNEIIEDETFGKNFRNNFNFNLNPSCSETKDSSYRNSGSNSENNSHVNDKISNVVTKRGNEELDIVDFTSAETDVVSNINEALCYNQFGNETIKKVPYKPVNKIIFNINNKKS